MNAFLDALGTYLRVSSIGTPGVDIFYDRMPTEPHNCVALILNGGPKIMGSPERVRDFQVLVRDTSDRTARTKAGSIYSLFDNVYCDVSSCRMPGFVGRFFPDHEPGPHEYDTNNHAVYTLNFKFLSVR